MWSTTGVCCARRASGSIDIICFTPNPWPKASQVSRRWHGHPVFPSLLDLGGVLECRSNWAIYLAEFCFAVRRMTQRPAVAESYAPDAAMTPFERKYLASGHRLFRMVVDLA
jgi:tRNA (guanine-N7-)-methyltransferase